MDSTQSKFYVSIISPITSFEIRVLKSGENLTALDKQEDHDGPKPLKGRVII